MEQIYIKTRQELRDWLTRNHLNNEGIWLVLYKKRAKKPSLEYDDIVEECLCFGWIDSLIKRVDEEKYLRKITPRKSGGNWSEVNKKRVQKLQRLGLISDHGYLVIDEAKKSGRWKKSRQSGAPIEIPDEFKTALSKNKKASSFFEQLAPSYKKRFIGWISDAKRKETVTKRVSESIMLLERGKKLEMK